MGPEVTALEPPPPIGRRETLGGGGGRSGVCERGRLEGLLEQGNDKEGGMGDATPFGPGNGGGGWWC